MEVTSIHGCLRAPQAALAAPGVVVPRIVLNEVFAK